MTFAICARVALPCGWRMIPLGVAEPEISFTATPHFIASVAQAETDPASGNSLSRIICVF